MSVVPLRRLGGSDAAAACGIDPFRSRVMAWCEFTGRVERPESEAMRWGKLLEPLVVAELQEQGYDAWSGADEAADSERPWLVGHPDGFAHVTGYLSLLEVKTAGQWSHRTWNGDVPNHYAAQIQHYLHLTGLPVCLFACLVAGQRLEVRTVERDQAAIDLLLGLEEDFYGYVTRNEPPPPDGSDSSREAVAAMFPETNGRKVRLSPDEWRMVKDLRARKEQRDAIDEQITELENRLKLVMGEAEVAVSPVDTEVLRWHRTTARRVNVKQLREQRPELAELFTVETTTRRFVLA